jgi:hypothetical protein
MASGDATEAPRKGVPAMVKKFLIMATATFALSLAAFGAYSALGHQGHAEAARLIHCTATEPTPPDATITCVGKIIVITPFGHKTIDFTLVVTAIDNPPQGPSFGDEITGCTIDFDGDQSGPLPIHIGPCP